MAIITEHFLFLREGEGQTLSMIRELFYAEVVTVADVSESMHESVLSTKWLIILINRLWMTLLLFMEYHSFFSIQLWLQSTNSHSGSAHCGTCELMKLNLLQFKIFASWWQINSIKKGKSVASDSESEKGCKNEIKIKFQHDRKNCAMNFTTIKCRKSFNQILITKSKWQNHASREFFLIMQISSSPIFEFVKEFLMKFSIEMKQIKK